MIETQAQTIVWVTEPQAAVNNASATTAEINRVVNGVVYNYVTIYVRLGATDIALTALKVQESDTTGTDFTDIPGATFASALPAATDDNKTYAFFIDGRGRKSIFDLVLTVGNGSTGAYVTAFAVLSNATEEPDNDTARGLAASVIIPIA